VVPEDAGQKAYALLYRSLQVTGLVAVAQLAMHRREHVVILRPGSRGIIAHTMFSSSEVRADEEYTADTRTVRQKELDLAQTLIHSLTASFEPEKYRDTHREKLESIIAGRVAGQPVATPEKPSSTSSMLDITEALQKSLAP
jgi:DNA end-binding protein Ku